MGIAAGTASLIAATTTSLGALPRCVIPDAIEEEILSMIGARSFSSADGARAFAVARDIALIAVILSL